MAHQRSKLCPSCHTVFRGRPNARTCSDRCRKRLQRANASLQKELQAKATVEFTPADLLLYRLKVVEVAK